MIKTILFIALLGLVFIYPINSFSDNELCTISGVLVDEKKDNPVEGITLALWGYGGMKNGQLFMKVIQVKGQVPLTTTSDKKGYFVFKDIPKGSYLIVQEINGVSQIENLLEIRRGNKTNPAISVKKGQKLNLGNIKVKNRK